jgi:hypothetical protein
LTSQKTFYENRNHLKSLDTQGTTHEEMAPTIRVPVTHLHTEQEIVNILARIKDEELSINYLFDASSDPSDGMYGDENLEYVEAGIQYCRAKRDFLLHYRHKTLSADSLSIVKESMDKLKQLALLHIYKNQKQQKSKQNKNILQDCVVFVNSTVNEEYEYFKSAWEEQWVA